MQDPGNVGTLIRSAIAFNYKDIYLVNSASISNEKVVRSTMGAIFKANIYELDRQEFELRAKLEEKKKEYELFKSKMERFLLSQLDMLKDEEEE